MSRQEIYCERCRKRAQAEDKFCRNCGKKLPVIQPKPSYWRFKVERSSIYRTLQQKSALIVISTFLIASVGFNTYQYLYVRELRSETFNLIKGYEALRQSYNNLSSKYDILKSEVAKLHQFLDGLSEATKLRAGIRPRELLTPDDQLVAEAVLSCTGGWTNATDLDEYWADLRRMYDWVRANIVYSYDTPTLVIRDRMYSSWHDDFWKYPQETIMDGHGDCEDQALLLCSMIRNYNHKKYDVWVVLTNGHAAVMVPTNDGQLTILDPAEGFFTRTAWWQLTSKPTREAVQEWIDYCENRIPNLTVLKIFNEEIEVSFSGNDEFLSWLQQKQM